MAIKYGIALFSVMIVFVISLVVFCVTRVNARSASRGSGMTGYWITLVVVAVVFGGCYALNRTFVCAGVYDEEIWKGREAQRTVKEILVQDVPELSGLEPREIAFDLREGKAVAIHGQETIVINDDEAIEYVESYFGRFHDYDYESAAEESVAILAMISSAIMSFAVSYAIEATAYHFKKKKNEEERRICGLL